MKKILLNIAFLLVFSQFIMAQVITTSGTFSNTFENVFPNSSSLPQTFTVSATGLTSNLVITTPSTDFAVSTSCSSGYASSISITPTSGTVSTTTIYVKFTPKTTGTKSGNISCTSTGASAKNIAVSEVSVASTLPSTYYSNATGTGTTLKTNLYNIIKNNNNVSYDGLWTAFNKTDIKPNGKIWDMYSNLECTTPPYEFNYSSGQCGTYSIEGDCYNREHSFPANWFNSSSPMYTDLFHIVPTDGKVNGMRSNYAFGVVASPTKTSENGSKYGSNSYPGSTGVAFEPVDEYKGDFARNYFYMATRYENVIANWEANDPNGDYMLDGTSYPCFETWALQMLLDWNAADPVSQKELSRNDAVYALQGNRNPYIDHPEYVNQVWGTPSPTLSVSATAVSGLSYIFGNGPSANQSFSLTGAGLTGFPSNISITAPTNYEISKDNVTYTNTLTVAYTSSNLASTTIYVRLKVGLSLNSYDGEIITISGGGASNITVICNGSVSNEVIPTDCGSETFANIPSGSSASSYEATKTWLGDDGKTWTATTARADQVFTTGNKAICFKGYVESPSTGNGVGDITVTTKFPFTSDGTFNLPITVNGIAVGTVPVSATQTTTTLTGINIAGNVQIKFTSDGTKRPLIDNLLWTCYSQTVATPKLFTSNATLTGFTYIIGSGPATSQTINITGADLTGSPSNIIVTAPTNYEVSLDNITFSSVVNVAFTSTTLSSTAIYVRLKASLAVGTYNTQNIVISGGGATSINVTCSGEVQDLPVPTISSTKTELLGFSYEIGKGPSSAQTLYLSGINLINFPSNIVVTAPTNFEVSLDNSSFSASVNVPFTSEVLSSTVVYVRLKSGLNIANYDAEILNIAGDGTNIIYIACSGIVTDVMAATDCENETFTNIPSATSTSYSDRTWTGDDGKIWTATTARTDQVITTNDKAICFKGYLESPTITGGIGDLTITTKFNFADGTFDLPVTVNGVAVGTVPVSATAATTTISGINIAGDVVVRFTSGGTKRPAIDNLKWTCYNTLGIENEITNENNFIIYPNPNNGSFSIKIIDNQQISTIIIRDITGKSIYSTKNNVTEIKLNLTAGIYFVELQTEKNIITKRFIVK